MTIFRETNAMEGTEKRDDYTNGVQFSEQMNGLENRIDIGPENGDQLTETQYNHDDRSSIQSNEIDVSSSRQKRDNTDGDIVQKLIENSQTKFMVTLDLSKKGLRKIPNELLALKHIEYLYLEGNELACLPENFFDCLPNLQWLDLRNNSLYALPSTYIGRHTRLRNLLLEGNELRTLPLELGLVKTINGLNIAKNPLEFPPQEVIERGTSTILLFLREVLKAKSLGRFPAVPKIEDLKIESEDNSSEDEWGTGRGRRKPQHSASHQSSRYSSKPGSGTRDLRSHSEDLLGPVMLSASLQRRTSYNEVKQLQLDKLRRTGVTPKRSSKRLTKLSQYPEPPPIDNVEQSFMEDRQMARIKDLKEKQDAIIQRRRDEDALKDWRDDSKQKQIKKQREKMIKGKIDYEEPAKTAPFGVDEKNMKMETNEERIARDIREKHENLRKAQSPETLQRLEAERTQRDQELQKKLRDHTQQMQERRRRPKGNPQEEMVAAKRELEIAENLQREIQKQKEYRFTAFTGDSV